jgi:pyridinium-3,5-bisthiocarboxylic acid mononucleotide nickel chelatase
MSETIAYFDCFSGASGDMILGALLDCGLPLEALAADLELLAPGLIRLRSEKVLRGGIRALQVTVETPDEPGHPHRSLETIRAMILGSRLPERVKERAIAVFTRLGEAEAAIHGVPVEKIHFHEVGALDAIADIVGAAAGLERLGVGAVFFSALRLGGGTVKTQHGTLPVPAPATAVLVAGLQCELGPVQRELLTPTGAAILTTLGRQQSPGPLRVERIGYGAGARDDADHPNVLRLMLGRAASQAEGDSVWALEINLDDTTAEVIGHTIEQLLAAGALDAWAMPIQMKKSRPAWMLCAIVEDGLLQRAEDILFRETTTFGIRRHRVERTKLARELRTVETPFGPIRVKVGTRDGRLVTASPEYEDCRRIALEKNIPLREVMDAARQSFVGMTKVE